MYEIKTIYVGNLPYDVQQDELRDHFAPREIVRITLPINRETNRPTGFGFVEFRRSEDARSAIEQFDQTEFGGRLLKVAEAQEKPRGGGGGGGRVRRDEGRRGKGGGNNDYSRAWQDK